MIYVTRPFLPPQQEYLRYIDDIWKRQWLTNNGPLVNELELKLKEYLEVSHLLYLNNGTTALQIAIKVLDLKGEIITSPFSYVATTSSIVWEGCKPIFVDIDGQTLNIDANKIEPAITKDTSAILATHVYGNPCDIEAIERIARKHNIKVIYDAAHAFGTKYRSQSLFAYGDISTASFHATKLFHTIEGGAVITKNPELLRRMAYLRNFGHEGTEAFGDLGINGKNSELHAAMGLCNLRYISNILERRKVLSDTYSDWFSKSVLRTQEITPGTDYNYSYYPVIFPTETLLLKTVNALNIQWIYPRRYFYPALHLGLPYITETYNCEVAESISSRVLCLPLYDDLSLEEQEMIIRVVLRSLNF